MIMYKSDIYRYLYYSLLISFQSCAKTIHDCYYKCRSTFFVLAYQTWHFITNSTPFLEGVDCWLLKNNASEVIANYLLIKVLLES